MYNQQVDEYRGAMNPNQSDNRVADAKVKAQKIKIKRLDEKIQSLKKALDKIPTRNTQAEIMIKKQIDDLEIDRDIEMSELEEENTPVILRKSSSNASYDDRGAAEENTSRN